MSTVLVHSRMDGMGPCLSAQSFSWLSIVHKDSPLITYSNPSPTLIFELADLPKALIVGLVSTSPF